MDIDLISPPFAEPMIAGLLIAGEYSYRAVRWKLELWRTGDGAEWRIFKNDAPYYGMLHKHLETCKIRLRGSIRRT
jgi:hypothetical protein